jgi:hypothetical protein
MSFLQSRPLDNNRYLKVIQVHEFGILDHEFVGAGLEWKVYVRVVPNEEGSTTTWTFMRPDGLTDDMF